MIRKDTVLIIPVYNEEKVIKDVIKNALKQFKYIVCINDGSNDNSSQQIAQTNAILIEHPINMGQGAALQTGIEFSRSLPVEYFVTYDADGQHRLQDVARMLKEIEKGKHDIILGSRFLGNTIGMKKSKAVVLKLAIKFSNFVSGMKLTDTHNGLRTFNRHVAETMNMTVPDMAHASEILDIIKRNGYRYKEVPVVIEYSAYSLAKGQTLINAVNIGFDVLLRKIAR
jgi:glycosyltransferase involved in cell wall biosynthesis